MFKFYEVGGKVRDEILGLESKDVDYVAVPVINYFMTSTLLNQSFQCWNNT
jgi:tRNA nucleotidyltransferase/poly(A) polymerase